MRIIILSFVIWASLTATGLAAERTTADIVKKAASEFLDTFANQQKARDFDVDYSLGRIDARLTLAPCPEAPQVSFSSDPFETAHPTLLVACKGKRPWRLFVSAELIIKGTGLVASRALSRGARISSAMISEQSVTINASRSHAITDRESLVGMALRRSMNAGSVFTPGLLNEPDAVARGDHVVIVARAGGIAVQSRGQALTDGKVGEQIRVRNLASSRMVRAKIVATGRVEVPM